MIKEQELDHLFRHQYGKMVSILTRIFGLSHIETIEDAVQDTFLNASLKWRKEIPENPEAWLTKAAKNRAIDLLRKIKTEHSRILNLSTGPSSIAFNQLFLEHEIEDSQLRMIFTACHPKLKPQDQIAFALKTIAGFSGKEIASALLLKESTVKKRLARARKTIKEKNLVFQLPKDKTFADRLHRVHEVIYLIFNEGFHSNQKEFLIRKDLCGEAIRLSKLILKKESYRTGSGYALFALLCFHASRLESKISEKGKIIDLKNQNRTLWFKPLIQLGKHALSKSEAYPEVSSYYFEAAIAQEHLDAKTFEETDWKKILVLYQNLNLLQETPFTSLNLAIVLLQLNENKKAIKILNSINPKDLEQRSYLYYGSKAEYHKNINEIPEAINCIEMALSMVNNAFEKKYFEEKKSMLKNKQSS
ncbi:RNA polymerase sigma-70 factor (ECF subfamily) [Saonia flava]|uniref:RNA polymerase sigma-70 factor (ECF subfamily) n=1 Tax=Saonia flava TaxID=523696 RepID=A0A846QNQ1_9FLAO|nr:sigma-70 family RNA polymerase sigma factor [Saonia flava]NJB70686.1 RNA polymerase sigma-70 factor (ECF subfamily) [Saonia flava]